MDVFEIDISSFYPTKIDEVWPLAATPTGLIKLTPKIFQLVLQEPGVIEKGEFIRLGIKVPGLNQALDWIAEIVDCKSEGDRRYFVDRQSRGPFKFYEHLHVFEKGQGGTWVRDFIKFTPPKWSPAAVSKLSLERLIRGRHENLKKNLG